MKNRFLIILLTLITNHMSAQVNYSQRLKGTVTDEQLKYPLVDVTVKILQEGILIVGTKTNEKGEFKIEKLPVGRYTVSCSYIGYMSKMIQNVELNSGKETQLFIELPPSALDLKELVIKNKKGQVNNSMANVSARNFNPEEASRYVASREDIARMATNFAGVRGSDDSRNDIVIRGNTPNGVLWRVEGFDVNNPNHFASFGTTGGPVNIINNKLLGNSDFMTGAFPADYGNCISGVFDLKLRNGNKEKHEFTAQLGILGIEATAEGPLNKKSGASYTFSYRYATLSIMNKLGINFGSSGNPSYQDLNFKLNFPLKKIGQLSFFGLGGKSDIAILDNGEDSAKWTFGRAGRDIHFGSRFGLVGVSFQQNIKTSFYHKISIGANLNNSYSRYDTIGLDKITRAPTYRNKFTVNKYILNYQATKRLSSKSNLKGGIILTEMMMNLVDSNFYPDQNIWYNEAEFRDDAQLLQAYCAWNYSPSNALKVNLGLHYTQFLLNNSKALEPRFGISYSVNQKLQINAGYGLHSNLQPLYIYFLQTKDSTGKSYKPNINTGFNRSHHIVVGADYNLNRSVHTKVEIYYQRLFNLPQEIKGSAYTPLNQGASFNFIFPGPLENKGKGYNAGIDLTIEKYFSKNFYFLTTGSIYTSQYQASDRVWRNTEFNGRYNFNFLSGKEFIVGKARTAKIIAGFKFNIAGGKWYTPIDSAKSAIKRQYEGLDAATNTLQFSTYHRLDLRFGFKKNLKRYNHHFYIDIINAYNQKNVLGLSYIPKTGEIVKETNLGFLPLFNWLVEF
jgi:hypothetical protein